MHSDFAQQMAKLPRVKGTITKTNVLKKNPNYKAIVQLGEFLNEYDDIGYAVRVIEQNPVVTEEFQENIFRNVLFNYLVLKGYLEREQDRRMPVPVKEKKRNLKPKFVKEIIEELTEDYDLPEVEIRRVLIEELTKEQLMQEEAAERRRLVEEQEKRKKEEKERLRKEQEAEKERLRKEKAAEKERLRQEKAAEEARLRQEQINREIEDTIRSKALKKELRYFAENLEKNLKAREEAALKKAAELKEFEDAAKLLEEAERRKQEAEEREKKRIKEERDRIRREKQLAMERARREEEERLERERQAKLAEEERLRREEEARLAKIRQEEEERQAQLRREQDARDAAATAVYLDQVTIFLNALPQRLQLRQEEAQRVAQEQQQREMDRQRRQLFRGLFRNWLF
jgi:trichohyalin